ncbi:HNH endonuclease signature motif containing protein [Corynebacterium afermentans]|uniref:HNH endonuclease signature motif containing protein n=1 Tax=Corynebacterium afermentans TaxID=38286 RepID=UPI002573E00A|nr:HNH endonuclease signature motif containing protein [Corynebacterium afermentans]
MTPFQEFLDTQPTIRVLEGFDKRAAIAAGVIPNLASKWEAIHKVYFGATRWTKHQRLGRKAAEAFPLSQLVYIEDRLKKIPNEAERWRVRRKLLEKFSTHHELKAKADRLILKPARTKPKLQVTFGRSVHGRRTIRITADEHDAADIEAYLREDLDPTKPPGPQMLRRFLDLVRGCGGGIPFAARRPIVVVGLDQHVQILSGDGDDVILGLTDGTTITGAEYLASEPELAEVALFHPTEGALNLYQTQRYANDKQRDLARMTLTVCPWPGCRHGSDACEIHHMQSWAEGGETNMRNLVPVCRYHNQVNHDIGSHANRRGSVKRVKGKPMWVSPNGIPAANRYHPYGAMEVLFGSGSSGARST